MTPYALGNHVARKRESWISRREKLRCRYCQKLFQDIAPALEHRRDCKAPETFTITSAPEGRTYKPDPSSGET